jgi:hypothetical protein
MLEIIQMKTAIKTQIENIHIDKSENFIFILESSFFELLPLSKIEWSKNSAQIDMRKIMLCVLYSLGEVTMSRICGMSLREQRYVRCISCKR